MAGVHEPAIDLVVPVHNEADAIEGILREFNDVVRGAGIDLRLIVCEDGSSDGTADAVRALKPELPLVLLSAPERKGYSRAVLDGLRSATAPLVGYADGDGQYNPADFVKLYESLDGYDLVVGYRDPRHDHPVRMAMSAAFRHLAYERLFPVRLKDPSSPFGIVRRDRMAAMLDDPMAGREMPQGFWWEFYARMQAAGVSIREIPVQHRVRVAGTTQVYRPKKVPWIAAVHLRGLWQLRKRLRRAHAP